MTVIIMVLSGVSICCVADTKLEADFERAQKEIEQLKTDHDVAIERKDREVSSYVKTA